MALIGSLCKGRDCWVDCHGVFGILSSFFLIDLKEPKVSFFSRSFGLTQKNQKVKAAPAGLLRFAAGGKWMKLASLKQHPFRFRLPRRSASRPSAEAGHSLPASAGCCNGTGASAWNLLLNGTGSSAWKLLLNGTGASEWKLLFRMVVGLVLLFMIKRLMGKSRSPRWEGNLLQVLLACAMG